MSIRKTFFFAGIFLPLLYASAQDSTHLSKKEIRKLRKEEKVKEGKLLITPLMGPAYTPELGFTIAGGVLTSWRTDKKDTTLQRSSIPFNLGVGFKTDGLSAFFISAKPTTFWLHDKLRINADFWLNECTHRLRLRQEYDGVLFQF